jgi:hypothetical protein
VDFIYRVVTKGADIALKVAGVVVLVVIAVSIFSPSPPRPAQQQEAGKPSTSEYQCADWEMMTRRYNSSKYVQVILQSKITRAGYDCFSIDYVCFKGNESPHDIEVMCDTDKLDGNNVYMHSSKGDWFGLKIVGVKQNSD